jgi:mannosyl-3-phosphoglycerate phosphatase family protein
LGLVVFTDLDGTLLDHHTYDLEPARPALEALRARGVPLVPCSSKSFSELLDLWQTLELGGPLIAENGGGVYLPAGHPLARLADGQPRRPGWLGLDLALTIDEVRRRLAPFKARFGLRGFGDMDDQEVASLTGLPLRQAALARARRHDEPLLLADPQADAKTVAEALARAAAQAGLTVTRGGRFWHAFAGGGKGRAVALLSGLYRRLDPGLLTMALGDASNDRSMLAAVDRPVLVARPGGGHTPLDLPGLLRVPLPGPAGFNQAVLALLEEMA